MTLRSDRIAGVKRNVFFLGLVSFFNDFSAEMVQSVMPFFLTKILGAPQWFVGFLEGFADALASVLKLFSGWFSDVLRRRKLPAVLGYILSVATRPFLAFAGTIWHVFGLRTVDRIGKGFRDAPRDALIAESVDASELGKSFGFHRMMDTLGATIGPLTAFLLLPFLGNDYRDLFYVAFGIGALALISFIFVKEQRSESGGAAAVPRRPSFSVDAFRKNKKFILVVGALFVFGLGTLPILLVLLKTVEIGMNAGNYPLMYFVYSLAFVVTAVPLGKLSDRIGERTVIAFGFLLAALAYFGLARSTQAWSVTLFFAVLGIYQAATDGIQRVLAAKYVEKSLLATGQGFLNMALGFSSLGAGLIGGFLWSGFSSGAALIYAGIMSLVGLVVFWLMSRTRLSHA